MKTTRRLPDHDLYADQLYPCGYGFALRKPEPTPKRGEVEIGDVGFMQQGQFFRLFNILPGIHLPPLPDGGGELFGHPPGFVPFEARDLVWMDRVGMRSISDPRVVVDTEQERSEPLESVDMLSYYMCGHGADTPAPKPAATLEVGPDTSQSYLPVTERLVRYVLRHHAEWLDWATKGWWQFSVRPCELVVVYGTVKTSQWRMPAFRRTSEPTAHVETHESTTLENGGVLEAAGSATQTRDSEAVIPARFRAPEYEVVDDQCMFVKWLAVKNRADRPSDFKRYKSRSEAVRTITTVSRVSFDSYVLHTYRCCSTMESPLRRCSTIC